MMPRGVREWKLAVVRVLRFARHVLRRFQHHRGLLLSGAVAYNVLLSVIPLGCFLLVTLSNFVDREELLTVFSVELEHLLPGRASELTEQVADFWEHRELFGGLSLLFLLFFGSLAFRVLGDAMTAIFADARRISPSVRGFWSSMVISFLYVGVTGAGLIVLAIVSPLLAGFGERSWSLFGADLSLDAAGRWSLWAAGLASELLLFTSVYMVLPGIKVRVRDALVAGSVATVLWEITRRLLFWYFASVSKIGLLYGSLATMVLALISAEVAAIILLLGAQVLAEIIYARRSGMRWHNIRRASVEEARPTPGS